MRRAVLIVVEQLGVGDAQRVVAALDDRARMERRQPAHRVGDLVLGALAEIAGMLGAERRVRLDPRAQSIDAGIASATGMVDAPCAMRSSL